jgi:leader peptidase (prepilin peptidase) / N-methyltransferase
LPALSPFVQVAIYLAVTLLGLVCGVAVNALADQVAGDEEPPWRASICHKCGKPLLAVRRMPFLSLSRSRRACASCGQPASLRRPALEIALAIMFPLLLAHLWEPASAVRLSPWALFAIDTAGCAVLAFVFAVDLEHHLILDVALYPAALLLLLVALFFDHKAFAGMLFGVVLCGGLFLLFYGLGYLLYRQEALGFGDVKLAALIGLLVGWPAVIQTLVFAALFGAAISVLLLGLGSATRRTYIPYGVFLAVGAVLALLLAAPFW